MANDVSVTTWTGVASCALSCGCFALSWLHQRKARQIQLARPVERLEDLKELLPLLPLLVAVTGKAWASHPIKCEMSSQEAVLKMIRETEHSAHKQPDGTWEPAQSTVQTSITTTEWSLKDSCSELAVCNAEHADTLYMLEVGTAYTASGADRGLVAKAIDAVQGVKLLGRQKVETAIPVGQQLTAIGEVTQTGGSGESSELALRKPHTGAPFIISSQPLRDIIRSYQTVSKATSIAGWVFGSIGFVIFGSKIAIIGWSKWRNRGIRHRREAADRRRAAQRQANAAAGTGNGNGPAESANGTSSVARDGDEQADGGEGTCVICLERRSNSVFQACGHMCTCSECSSGLTRCPICRTKTRAIRVYHA